MLALFLGGLGLIVFAWIYEPYEKRKRAERLEQRKAEVLAKMQARWDRQDREWGLGKYAPPPED